MNSHRKNTATKPKVIIMGAGFAGINFVNSIQHKNCEIVLVDKNNYHQFQPLLYQVAISGLEPDSIVAPIRRQFNQGSNVQYIMGEIDQIDSTQKRIKVNEEWLVYDYLVIATGSKTNFYHNMELEKYAFGLKNINDALNIRSWILQELERVSLNKNTDEEIIFVITGAGPAGIEMAGALAEFRSKLLEKDYPRLKKSQFKIVLIEGGTAILSSMSKRAQSHALQALHGMGVDIILEALVRSFDGKELVYHRDGEEQVIRTRSLIWTAGVHGERIPGLTESSYNPQNRLRVNDRLKIIGCDDIFAIGDIAYLESPSFPKGLPMVAQTAIQQGRYLAKNILSIDSAPFIYKDKGRMATIGMRNAVADVNNIFIRGRLGWFLWSLVHLISITSFKNRISVAFNWLIKYIRYDRANQLIIRKVKRPTI